MVLKTVSKQLLPNSRTFCALASLDSQIDTLAYHTLTFKICIWRSNRQDYFLIRWKRVRDHRLECEDEVLLGSVLTVHVSGQVLFTRHHLDERITTGVDDKLDHIPFDIEIFPLIKRKMFDEPIQMTTAPRDRATAGNCPYR